MDRISSKTSKMITLNIFFTECFFERHWDNIRVKERRTWAISDVSKLLLWAIYILLASMWNFYVHFQSIFRFFNKFLSSNSSTQHFHHIWQIKRFQDTSYPDIMESSTCVSWIRSRMREKLCVKNKLLRGLRCSILLCLI